VNVYQRVIILNPIVASKIGSEAPDLGPWLAIRIGPRRVFHGTIHGTENDEYISIGSWLYH